MHHPPYSSQVHQLQNLHFPQYGFGLHFLCLGKEGGDPFPGFLSRGIDAYV
jgi:hypothetical protein